MEVIIECGTGYNLSKATLELTPLELLTVVGGLREFALNEDKHIQDRAEVDRLREQIMMAMKDKEVTP